MSEALNFPPLMSGMAAGAGVDPFDLACQKAALGIEAGLVVHDLAPNTLRAALILAPEVPLLQAMAMLPACGVGLQNALGALAPPEVAVHLHWSGAILVNGAACGALKVAASTSDPAEVPDWLVIGLTIPLWPDGHDGGAQPDATALYAEGCADVPAPQLLEAWARHCLHWINRWDSGDQQALHADWRALAHGIGEPIVWGALSGSFLGVDEDFGMLLRDAETTHLIPLTAVLSDET